MAIDTYLLDRMRNVMSAKKVQWTEKKMFGGNCFMVDGKMAFGTFRDGMMARVDPEELDQLVTRTGAEQLIHGGRPMKGYVLVQPEGYDSEDDLEFWIEKCLEFNPKAKASKKKKKK